MEYLYDIYGILVEIYIIFLASGVPTIYIYIYGWFSDIKNRHAYIIGISLIIALLDIYRLYIYMFVYVCLHNIYSKYVFISHMLYLRI